MPTTTSPGGEAVAISDEALMEALQAGDDPALTVLMQRWEVPVKAFILRMGVAVADVEDVAQETFVRLYEKRGSYRPGSPFKPWLLTLAGNLSRNRLRWRFRRREDSIETVGELAKSVDSDDALEQESLARAVRAAVESLPDRLRQAVVCVELEDLSYSETAKVMGCSPKAVETRLYRARRLLRWELSSAGIDGEYA